MKAHRSGLCAMPFCHSLASRDAHFAVHECHAMIVLPYTRITWCRYVASTENKEGGRVQHSPGYVSMVYLDILSSLHPVPLAHAGRPSDDL